VTPRRRPTLAGLAARLAALEDRVARLETGRAPPGDGRAAAVKRERPVKRCPGCGLPLRRRAGRCAACGRPLDSL
jgi:ribosomal protein L34E